VALSGLSVSDGSNRGAAGAQRAVGQGVEGAKGGAKRPRQPPPKPEKNEIVQITVGCCSPAPPSYLPIAGELMSPHWTGQAGGSAGASQRRSGRARGPFSAEAHVRYRPWPPGILML
jgi:hypothetical protein